MPAVRMYRALTRLYPRDFRARYRDDLVQHFADLVDDHGVRVAWTRTAIDLIVTVPRYRLEVIMNERHGTVTLAVAITLLAGGGLLSVPAGIYPGIVLLPLAGVLAIGQRSALARGRLQPDLLRVPPRRPYLLRRRAPHSKGHGRVVGSPA
ncbi:MAG: hypothetical protein ABI658_07250 [Acidimicrobiales bacterium]